MWAFDVKKAIRDESENTVETKHYSDHFHTVLYCGGLPLPNL